MALLWTGHARRAMLVPSSEITGCAPMSCLLNRGMHVLGSPTSLPMWCAQASKPAAGVSVSREGSAPKAAHRKLAGTISAVRAAQDLHQM